MIEDNLLCVAYNKAKVICLSGPQKINLVHAKHERLVLDNIP